MKKTALMVAAALALTLCVPLSAVAADGTGDPVLLAGQDSPVGSVEVSNDGWNLYVVYTVDAPGWAMTEAHLAVAAEESDIPQTKKGNPIPGQFPYSEEFAEPMTGWMVTIPLGDLTTGDEVVVAAHAALVNVDEEIEETAWADGTRFVERGNWATWFTYAVAEAYSLSASGGGEAVMAEDPEDPANEVIWLSAPAASDVDPVVALGAEARIVMPVPPGTTLADIESIAWDEYLVTGYPPHVDIIIDTSEGEDALAFEYAYNDVSLHYPEGWPSYNALTGAWYATFSDDSDGPAMVDAAALGWLTSGPAGPPTEGNFALLGDWQSAAGVTYGAVTVNGDTPVLRIEVEVDNWIGGAEAYVDNLAVVLSA